MNVARELTRYVAFGLANKIPRFHTLDHVRTSFFRIAGLKVGAESRVSSQLTLDFSLRRSTIENVAIGNDCFLGFNCRISASKATVHIGDRCNIGPGTSIDTAGHWFNHETNKRNSYHRPVVIQENVWIGAGCIILPGVTIGRNSIVAAGAVVARDVDEGVLVGGVPAKTIKVLPDFAPRPQLAGAEA